MTFFPNSGNIPKLRFSEFTGNWIKYHLKEIAEKANNKNNNNKISTVFSNSAVQGIVLQSDYFDKSIANKENLEGYYVVEPFDFVYNPRLSSTAEVGAMSVNKTNLTGLVSPLYTVFRIKENNINIPFLEYLFKSKVWHNYMRSIANYGARDDRMNVRSDDFYNLPLTIPNFSEQNKISTFLSLIEVRIQTQRKIIEKLETLMKASRINIFSQKLRFKDKQGYDFPDWKKLKLGKIGNFQTSSIDKLSKENENEVYLVNYMNVYRHEDINPSTIKSFQKVTAKEQQITSCNLKKGDILFTPSSETPDDIGHSVVISENLENAVFSYHLMRFRPKIEIDILYSHYFCNVPIVLNQLSKFATGSTRFTISVKSFSDVEISLPGLTEQKVIGRFLSLVENKIDTEKQILEKLEFQKKFLLANLFV
jgi:type I restriction enzyme S subunit